jgi:hypothetical protein
MFALTVVKVMVAPRWGFVKDLSDDAVCPPRPLGDSVHASVHSRMITGLVAG